LSGACLAAGLLIVAQDGDRARIRARAPKDICRRMRWLPIGVKVEIAA
jgi:hypothetical protein